MARLVVSFLNCLLVCLVLLCLLLFFSVSRFVFVDCCCFLLSSSFFFGRGGGRFTKQAILCYLSCSTANMFDSGPFMNQGLTDGVWGSKISYFAAQYDKPKQESLANANPPKCSGTLGLCNPLPKVDANGQVAHTAVSGQILGDGLGL